MSANRRSSRSIADFPRRSSSAPTFALMICDSSPRTMPIRSIAGKRCRPWPLACSSTILPLCARTARRGLQAAVGEHLAEPLLDHYRRLSESGPYEPDAVSAGRRTLRNTCLDLLAATQRADAILLAARQYQAANNMTDRMAALSTLSLCDVPERAAALDDFYARYADDALIVDKWLTLQATIPEPATLDRVKALTKHPAFSFANPNRVRALIHAFALANQKEFNRADGAGYDFIVDTVLALDPKNPQVAARLLSSLKSWRVLEPGRRARAEAALRRVAAAPSLSPDVSDIAQRALAKD